MAPQLDTKSEADATTKSLDTAAKAAFASSGRHEEAAALFGQLLLTGCFHLLGGSTTTVGTKAVAASR